MNNEIVGRGWSFPPTIDLQGGWALTNDRNEVEQAIEIILLTAPGQRVMRPNFGCRVHELVFAPNNDETAAEAKRFVEDALKMWEPRINLIDVRTGPDPNNSHCLLLEVDYEIKATHDKRSLVYPFYLIPQE